MSQGFIKAAIRSGELPVIKLGSQTRVQMADLEQWWLTKRRTKEQKENGHATEGH